MPVSFFIDPQIVGDKDARGATHITLSYTFYPVAPPKPGLAGQAGRQRSLRHRQQCRGTGPRGIESRIESARRAAAAEGIREQDAWPTRTPSTTTTTW